MKQITLNVHNAVNFTPASLMKAYADSTPGVAFTRNVWGSARLIIQGSVYRYHHWDIVRDNDREIITLTLELSS